MYRSILTQYITSLRLIPCISEFLSLTWAPLFVTNSNVSSLKRSAAVENLNKHTDVWLHFNVYYSLIINYSKISSLSG